MGDLNFFDPYIEKRKFKISKRSISNILLLLSIISLIGYGTVNQIRLSRLRTEANSKQAIAENPKILRQTKQARIQKEEIDRFAIEVKEIQLLNSYIEDRDIVNESFLKAIISRMPVDMFLTSFHSDNEHVDMSGVSRDKLGIAQFKKGMESIECIDDIFVSSIIREEDFYIFDINITLEGVNLYENGKEGETIQGED